MKDLGSTKSAIIESGLAHIQNKYSFALNEYYKNKTLNQKCGYVPNNFRDIIDFKVVYECANWDSYQEQFEQMILDLFYTYNFDYDIIDTDEWRISRNINSAYYKRYKRLRQKMSKLLEKECVFLTLTFDNKYIKSRTSTHRKYVTNFLGSFNCPYIANVDYGAKNHREHFHAVLQSNNIDPLLWKYGACNVKLINVKNDKALSKYLAKLTNHAIKETTKNMRIIYSKDNT